MVGRLLLKEGRAGGGSQNGYNGFFLEANFQFTNTGDENNKHLINPALRFEVRKRKETKIEVGTYLHYRQASATPSQLRYIGGPTLPLAPSATFVLALETESKMQSCNCSTVKLLVASPVQDVEAGLCGGARPLPSVSVYNPAAVLLRQ